MDELNIKPQGSEKENPQVPNITPEVPAVSSTPSTSTPTPTAFSLDSIGSVNQQPTAAPSTEVAQPLSMSEKVQLPTGESSLSDAAMTPAGTPESALPKKRSLLKTGLIIAGVVVVVGSAAAAVFFSQNGWPFKGDITALKINEATRFAALTMCPDDQYQPKQSDTALQLLKSSLAQANAQSAAATPVAKPTLTRSANTRIATPPVTTSTAEANPDGIEANPNIAVDAVAMENKQMPAAEMSVSAVQGTQFVQNNTISKSEGLVNSKLLDQGVTTSSTNANSGEYTNSKAAEAANTAVETTNTRVTTNTVTDTNTVKVTPETVGNLKLNPGATQQSTCQDIPHDNLVPGDRECKMIDALYADPTSYLINDLTKSHLEEWYKTCHPTVVTEVQCRVNEEYSKETKDCVCKAGYFDISDDLPASTKSDAQSVLTLFKDTETAATPAAAEFSPTANIANITDRTENTAVAVGTRETSNLRVNSVSRCMNCDEINKYLTDYQEKLAATTDATAKAALQNRIDLLNKIAEAHGCKKTQVKCAGDQVLTSDGTCECPANSNFNESTQKCEFDCERVVKSIVSMRESTTKTPETDKQLNDLIALAEKNECKVPEEKTTCQTYQEDAQKALAEKNYDAYISISMKSLSAECGREVNSCQRTLAEATLVKRIMDEESGNTDLQEKYKDKLNELKAEYYNNPECRDDNRCSEIDGTATKEEAPTRAANAESLVMLAAPDAARETAVAPTTAEYTSVLRLNNTDSIQKVSARLTPSAVFEDDKEYYEKNCKKPDLTCEELLKRYNLNDVAAGEKTNVAALDVSEEVRQQITRCLPVTRLVPENPTLSCSPSTRNATTGQEVVWTATVDGVLDKEQVTYAWSGDAAGTGESVKASYNTQGEKNAVVVASIGGETQIRAVCTTNVSPIAPTQPPTDPPINPTPPAPPAPTPPPSAPAVAPPTPPSPVSSPTPPPSSAVSPIVMTPPPAPTPPPTSPAVAPPSPSSPIASPTPAPSSPVSLPITTPSAPVIATTSTPAVVSPAAPGAPVIHSSAPVTVVTPSTPVATSAPVKEIPPTITPTGPEVYIYLIGFVVGQLYFFRRKVFALVRGK